MLPGMTRRRWLWVLGIAAAALFLVLALIDLRIQDTGGPGIIGLELARSNARVTEIMAQWGATGQDAARLSIWLDFPYLILYGAFLTLAVLALRDAGRERGWDRYARWGIVVAFLPVFAALCDVAEDAGMLLMLEGRGATRLPQIVTGFALLKFAALAAVALYLLTGLGALARRPLRWSHGWG
jgi:hypothetical protein